MEKSENQNYGKKIKIQKLDKKNNSLVWHRKMVSTIWQKLKFKNWTKIIL